MLTYFPGNSFLHRLDPTAKVGIALLMSIACFIPFAPTYVGNIIVLLWIMAAEVLIGFSCGLGGWTLKSLWGLLKFCSLLFVIQIVSYHDGELRWVLWEAKNWYITLDAALIGLILCLRLTASAVPLALMLRVTKPLALADSLYNRLHMPYKFAFAFSTAMRFIPVFAEEMAEITEAQTARGVELDTRNIFKKIRLLMPLCVPLLLSSVRKLETAVISAELRGFELRRRK